MIRLDLGAGNKRFDGWLAIDAVQRGDKPLDVVTDLAKLPFPDNHADEARAIHVIEHFHRGDVPAVLREWIRVLKPGASLALECPDLNRAIYFLLAEPERQQLGLWALYGDPQYREDAMIHRWAYTPAELGNLMLAAGLTKVRVEKAQFHVPIRDMRLVGEKP